MKHDDLSPVIDDIPNWHELGLHDLCSIFPAMQDDDYDGLVASMKDHGFLKSDPIILVDSTPESPNTTWVILDGRNRHLAAMDAGKEPEFMAYSGNNPIGFVTSRNLDRRHLTTGQKAAVAAELATLLNGQNSGEQAVTQTEAAERIGVGEATLRRFKYVEKYSPELAKKVKSGEIPLEKARSAIKKELNEGKSIEDAVEESTPRSLGDKRAKCKEREKSDITANLNEVVVKLVEKFTESQSQLDADMAAEVKKLVSEAVLAGYKIGKGG